jgi:hypothetical protein
MKALAAGLLSALAFAGTASSSSKPSGLYGIVMRGPITPVCVAGQPCDEPAAGVTLVFSRAGHAPKRATTTKTGHYRLRLAPGRYTVGLPRPQSIGGFEPQKVRVVAARYRRADFSIDTGIR